MRTQQSRRPWDSFVHRSGVLHTADVWQQKLFVHINAHAVLFSAIDGLF